MTYVETLEKERDDNLNALIGMKIPNTELVIKEIVAWTIPNSFERPLRAIVKDERDLYRSMEYSHYPHSYSELKWHELYPFIVREENVRAQMGQFAWAGYDNAVADIHWVSKEEF